MKKRLFTRPTILLTSLITGGAFYSLILNWTLSNVIINSCSINHTPNKGAAFDSFGLNFGRAQVQYIPQNPNGSDGSPINAGFGTPQNKMTSNKVDNICANEHLVKPSK